MRFHIHDTDEINSFRGLHMIYGLNIFCYEKEKISLQSFENRTVPYFPLISIFPGLFYRDTQRQATSHEGF